MKILIVNHCLYNYAGTENYVFEIANYFVESENEVFIFSPLVGRRAYSLVSKKVCIVNDLKKIRKEKFDIIHAHHNKTSILTRIFFPNIPMIFLSHGILPSLEQPPCRNINITFYGAVSEEVQENVSRKCGIKKEDITIIRNFVDFEKFYLKKNLNIKLKKVLVLSNHYVGDARKNIETVCSEMGLLLVHVGLPNNSVTNVEDYINDADIVITLGKGVLESLACKRNVIVYDKHGCDGFMTKELYYESRKNNFSGRRYGNQINQEALKVLFGKYSSDNYKEVYKIIKEEHSIEIVCKRLLNLYMTAIRTHPFHYSADGVFDFDRKEIFIYKFLIFYLKIRHVNRIKFF